MKTILVCMVYGLASVRHPALYSVTTWQAASSPLRCEHNCVTKMGWQFKHSPTISVMVQCIERVRDPSSSVCGKTSNY